VIDAEDLDSLDDPAYVPPPYVVPPTVGERTMAAWRAVTATPLSAALATIDLLAIVVLVVALRPVKVEGADARGPLTAHCGIAYYLFGHPNPVVDQGCGRAYGGHADVVFVAALAAITLTSALVVALLRRRRGPDAAPTALRRVWEEAVSTPGRSALVALAGGMLVVGVLALRTVPARSRDAVGPFTAHCGLSFYIFGQANPVVTHLCRHTYAARAWVLILAVLVIIASAAWLGVVVVRDRLAAARAT